jgi:hypothetical protein
MPVIVDVEPGCVIADVFVIVTVKVFVWELNSQTIIAVEAWPLSRLQRIYPLQYCGITIQSLPPMRANSRPHQVHEPPDTVFSRHFTASTFKDTSHPASPIRDGGHPPPSRGNYWKRSPSPRTPPLTPPSPKRGRGKKRRKRRIIVAYLAWILA